MAQIIQSSTDLGTLIRRVRRGQRVRQDDLAQSIGTSHRFLRELERGSASQIQRLFLILDELGIHIEADPPGDAS